MAMLDAEALARSCTSGADRLRQLSRAFGAFISGRIVRFSSMKARAVQPSMKHLPPRLGFAVSWMASPACSSG